MRLRALILVLVPVMALAPLACGPGSTAEGEDTTTNAEIVSGLAAAGEALKGSSVVRAGDFRGSCSVIPYTACDNATQTQTRSLSTGGGNNDGCTVGSGAALRTLYGATTLEFSEPFCTHAAVAATISRTHTNLYWVNATGAKVLTYTGTGTVSTKSIGAADLLDYGGTTRSGGATLTRTGALTETLAIGGIHRRGVTAAGLYTFWHTLYTTTPVALSRGGGSVTITSGNLYLAQNRSRGLITLALTNVVFPSTCYLPTSGTMTVTTVPATGATTSFVVAFSGTCGTVTIDGVSTAITGGT